MTPLFVSFACDWCDGVADPEQEYVGYIVWRNRPFPTLEYVFPDEEQADKWRRSQGMPGAPIREVRSLSPFQWRESTGSLRDLTLADKLYEIHEDRRYAPQPNRAYLAA